MKREVAPTTDLIPTPVVLVTTQGEATPPNIITLAWVGVVNSDPPMVGIGIRPERYSYRLLKESGEFCVNIPHSGIIHEVDVCGVVSGKTTDKFALTGLVPEKASKITPPLIRECPVNMECRLVNALFHNTRSEKSFHQSQDIAVGYFGCDCLHNHAVRQIVKETGNVRVQYHSVLLPV